MDRCVWLELGYIRSRREEGLYESLHEGEGVAVTISRGGGIKEEG